jgi:hypothetical protein
MGRYAFPFVAAIDRFPFVVSRHADFGPALPGTRSICRNAAREAMPESPSAPVAVIDHESGFGEVRKLGRRSPAAS